MNEIVTVLFTFISFDIGECLYSDSCFYFDGFSHNLVNPRRFFVFILWRTFASRTFVFVGLQLVWDQQSSVANSSKTKASILEVLFFTFITVASNGGGSWFKMSGDFSIISTACLKKRPMICKPRLTFWDFKQTGRDGWNQTRWSDH